MKKLAALALALTVPLMANAADYNIKDIDNFESAFGSVSPEIRAYVDRRIAENNPYRALKIKVDGTGFELLSDGYTTISVSVKSIQPYGKGSEIVLSVVNWMGVTMSNVKIGVTVGDYNNLPWPDKEENIQLIRPGSEAFLTVRVPQKPEEFNGIFVVYGGPSGTRYNKAQ